jgi:hypothetical protein
VSEAKQLLTELAKKLRSRAKWQGDPYYDDDFARAKNEAIRETLEGVAQDIEELLL